MNCLIIDKVWGGIAEELSKCMNVKTAENLPSSKEQLIAEIGDVDVLIMRVDPKIDKEIIDAAKNLKVIGVCSVGLNHIDLEYAKSKGIQVFNAPGLNANAVAELTISKMLDISRGTFTANYDVKVKHEWDKRKDSWYHGIRPYRSARRRTWPCIQDGYRCLRSVPSGRSIRSAGR